MAVAGFCRGCGQYVWLSDQWGCVNGHPWSEITNWYEPSTGTPVTPYWLQPTPVAVAEPIPVTVADPAPAVIAPPAAMPAPVAAPIPEPAPMPAPLPTPLPAPEPPVASAAVAPAAAPAVAPAPAATPAPVAPGDRLALLADMLATFGQYPSYRTQYGTDTDVVIDNLVADAEWGTGAKNVEFSAIMKAIEPEHTIYYWEMLKGSGGGLNFGGFDAEMSTTSGMKRWGVTKEAVIGPGGVAMDYTWDYAATRRIVEDVAARHGWKVKAVLQKKSAQW